MAASQQSLAIACPNDSIARFAQGLTGSVTEQRFRRWIPENDFLMLVYRHHPVASVAELLEKLGELDGRFLAWAHKVARDLFPFWR